MAHTYDITVRIKFDEHDNEQDMLRKLFHYLHRLKSDMEDKGHEDVFYDVDLSDLESHANKFQKEIIDRKYKNFADWGDYKP